MINFNGSLTHIPEKKWDFEKSLTLDKSFLLDIVCRDALITEALALAAQ